MLTKKKVIESLKDLPSNFSSEELIDRIIILDKIQIGITQSKEGKTISLKQAETKLKKWLK
jgi:hypothetical protein